MLPVPPLNVVTSFPVSGSILAPALISATVTIKRGNTIIVDTQPAVLNPPTVEQISMDGEAIRYQGTLMPAVNIRENDLLFVVSCASNPFLVSLTVGRLVTDVRQEGDPISATKFRATFKAQP